MAHSLSCSALLAAALLGISNLSAAQGLRVDDGTRSAWSFGVAGFADGGMATRLPASPTAHMMHMAPTPRPWLSFADAGGVPDDELSLGMSHAAQGHAFGRLGGGAFTSGFAARGVTGTARYALPVGGLQLFGGGGAGLYQFRGGHYDRYAPLDGNVGLHAVAGVSLPVADDAEVGLSLRRVWIRGDAVGAAGTVDDGGRFIFLGLRLTR